MEAEANRLAALEAAEGLPATASNLTRLGREFGDTNARWAFEQWSLRGKGKLKFSCAAAMVFTRDGLEMASHEAVAAWHASLFPAGETVVDATCGIGADLVALARRGPVIGLDSDERHLEAANWNLGANGLAASLIHGDCLAYLAQHRPEYVFADPARRSGSARARSGADYSPPLDELARHLQACKLAVLKLSPMLPDLVLESLGGRLVFVSHERECKEALVVLGAELSRGAVHIESGSELPAGPPPPSAEAPGTFFYEADPAAIRAHCLGSFGLSGLGDSNGYLTGDHETDSPWLRRYRVLWHGAWHEKSVKEELARLGRAVAAVKTRGVALEPSKVKAKLGPGNGQPAVLALWPVGKSVRATLLEPAHTSNVMP